jgi:tRNA pseudouridine55 synthase
LNGILNINKPYGLTSFDVVARVKKCTGVRHVGHAGTLDPLATGVLPVCLGQATRVVEFLMDTTKTYIAEIELGVTTETYDIEGKVVRRQDTTSVNLSQIKLSLNSFLGSIMQVPPTYSAIKVQGKPLYHWVRSGIVVKPESRKVTIFEMKLIDYTPPVIRIVVTCGKGTYIRSLANDLGEKLGCGAILKSLIRSRCGPFDINDSYSLPNIEENFQAGQGENLLQTLDSVLLNYPAVILGETDARKVICGNSLYLPMISNSQQLTNNYDLCRAYSIGGSLLAVLRHLPLENLWHPYKVFFQ